ncbi:protein yippee-like At3g08990 [Solanum stenotomum]|uniref:protein yippee-like At3g08990 n=1 Tax=Solanum stenotomum TaxID=172797 RepID=UPI0020D17A55|nr:protein yippee-like At3g08990 [Solanum stenotomum]
MAESAEKAIVCPHQTIPALPVQNGRTGVFNSVFNARFLNNVNYLRHVNGNTVADVYCVQCGMLLGLKLIAVPRPSQEIREGRFLMNLEKLVYWGDYSMIYQEQDGTVANIDQVLYELSGGVVVHPLVPSEQNGHANGEHAPMDQDGGDAEQLVNAMRNLRM